MKLKRGLSQPFLHPIVKKKVVFIDTVHPILEERLTASNDFLCIPAYQQNSEELKSELYDAVGIVIRSRFPMDARILDAAPHLEFIARSGAGMENIDLSYCEKRSIICFNSPEGNRNAVGEHALGMLLSLLNKLHSADQEVRNGVWRREENRGEELDGKTIGIIGYGNNGSAFAKKLRGFDVQVLAYDKYKTAIADDWVKQVEIQQIMNEADVISFHIPQNEETIYWANDTFFNALKKPIYLLNLSRGKIVDTKALLNAIECGKVKGAGLDVNEFEKTSFESFFEGEQPQQLRSLLENKQVILSPHVGGWTKESYFKLSDVLADKILSYYQNKRSITV